jgi:hypothetical protein
MPHTCTYIPCLNDDDDDDDDDNGDFGGRSIIVFTTPYIGILCTSISHAMLGATVLTARCLGNYVYIHVHVASTPAWSTHSISEINTSYISTSTTCRISLATTLWSSASI